MIPTIFKKIEKPFLIIIIFVNLILLSFICYKFYYKINFEKNYFEYGDKATALYNASTIYGDDINILPNKKKLTIAIFFNSSHFDKIDKISKMLDDFKNNNELSIFGIYYYNSSIDISMTEKYNLTFPIVADSSSNVHKHFKYNPIPNLGGILVLDKNFIVRLYLRSILSDVLLKDFIIRHLSKKGYHD